LEVSRFIVVKVTESLGMIPTSFKVDYLNHPQCPAEMAVQLRTAGHTHEEIGEHFGVCRKTVRKVLETYNKAKRLSSPPAE